MKLHKLEDYHGGWICGDFLPTIIGTDKFEVGFKEYKKGARENAHTHLKAIEISVFLSGKCRMNELIVGKGDIVVLEKGEVMTGFECLEDSMTAVIKIPSVKGDKYGAR
jgi:quercetin dioxygenase-like cupin family protein